MARLLSIVLLLHVSLIVVALVDCLSAEARIRTFPRSAWIFLILLASPIGAFAWFIAGQPTPAVRSRHGKVLRPAGTDLRPSGSNLRSGPGRRRPAGPIGPEDDPDFIASLAATLKQEEAE